VAEWNVHGGMQGARGHVRGHDGFASGFAGTIPLDRSRWLRLLPQKLRC
jgi:hypothetical protein